MPITINGTTGIAGVDGSASAPALQGSDSNTGVFFGTDTVTVATGGTAAVTVDSGQRTKFPTTIGVGNATPSTSGSGISFPATQSASSDANTLDDYEEGTFTPTIVGGSTAGSASYSSQLGIYRKIGSLVYVSIVLSWSSGTGTGSLRIAGLPFDVSTSYLPVFSVLGVNVALTASNVISGLSNLTTGIQIIQTPVGGGSDTTVSYDAAGSLYVTGTYATT